MQTLNIMFKNYSDTILESWKKEKPEWLGYSERGKNGKKGD